MKLSISNLAWPNMPVSQVAPLLENAGMVGVEIAPTIVWPNAPTVSQSEIRRFAAEWKRYGIAVSGIQSLMYGHPEFQVFDQATWPATLEHLKRMIQLSRELGSGIVVFGSPRNRIRGRLTLDEAHEMCATFMSHLVPTLASNAVVLTLEPNAPQYGADYLIHYADTLVLADLVSSSWVQPQIDTGSLYLVNENPVSSAQARLPAHIHISAPYLMQPSSEDLNHESLRAEVNLQGYKGWVVLEMLQAKQDPMRAAAESAGWLSRTYKVSKS